MARLINRLQLKPSKSSRQTVGQTLEPWFTVLNGFWTGFQVWPDIDRVSIRFYWVFTEFVDGKRGGVERIKGMKATILHLMIDEVINGPADGS